MKRLLLTLLTAWLCGLTIWAEDNDLYRIVPGHDYYIWNTYYDRPLTLAAAQDKPVLTTYAEDKDAQYVFTAEEAPTSGYVLLRHKASGRYICASTANSYATVTQTSAGTGDSYQWRIRPGKEGYLVNKKATGKALGVDADETKEEIGVWYDKEQGLQRTVFEVFEAQGKNASEARKAWAIKELTHAKDYVKGEIAGYLSSGTNNTKYSLVNIKKFIKTVEQTEDWLTRPGDFTTAQLWDKAQVIRDSLCQFFSGAETTVLLTESEMQAFGSSFSLSLSELKIKEKYAGDSVRVLLRNKQGMGAMFCLKADGNYVLVQEGAVSRLYKDGMLAETQESYYVPVISPQGKEAEWSLIRKSRLDGALPELLSENKVVTEGGGISTDKYGNQTRQLIALTNTTLNLTEPIDLHLISESAPLTGCSINLAHEKAWLIFDNVRPSEVGSKYLSQIKINGVNAIKNINCRIVIYLNGALVMPYKATDPVFEGFDGEQYSSESVGLTVGEYKDLGKDANRFRSFRLKRGYMATLASGKEGSGYSRVYVADHQDIEVPVLPNALYGRISSITVKKWQYVSKKGWCSTNGNDAIKSQTDKVRATWFYTWSADRSCTDDTEYIPIRQHKWWPSISQIAGHENATACLSINEPEHSEQHNDCDCGGALNEWTCCTLTPDFQKTGMRIGSPAPTDAGWLTNYINHCNDMAYRCDFVAIHCYWGDNEAADAQAWYNKLKAIYDATKRPIWITEWAFGASWTKESWPSDWNAKLEHNRTKVKAILEKLEAAPFVERYAYYQWDTQFRNLVDWSDGHVTPAGKVYRDLKSDFAYNASVQFTPVWWAPSLKTPSLQTEIDDIEKELIVTVTNENTDCTDIMAIQTYNETTQTWEDYYVEKDRSLFDEKVLTYRFPLTDFDTENGQLRVYVKRTLGDEASSAGGSMGYIVNPNIYATSKTSIEGWKCQKSAYNGYTKGTGDTYFEVWSEKAAGQQFDYYQEIAGLPEGIYELSADIFNSTNGVEGDRVNGSVVLYAQADTVQYLAPVTRDSEMEGAERLSIQQIIVRSGRMRIGVKNLGEMGARWAGADNFKLKRTGDVPEAWEKPYYENRIAQDNHSRSLFFTEEETGETTATAYIVNPSCQRMDDYGWTAENTETASGEAWDGNNSNGYWNKWTGSAYTSTLSQDITCLPEGKYAVNAMLRASADAQEVSLTATVLNSKGEVTGQEKALLTPTGNKSVEGSPYQNGWDRVSTEYVTVRPGDTLRLTMKAQFSKSGWWSADDFGLMYQYTDPIETSIVPVITSTPSTSVYDLGGRRLTKDGRGIFIKNGKKIINH